MILIVNGVPQRAVLRSDPIVLNGILTFWNMSGIGEQLNLESNINQDVNLESNINQDIQLTSNINREINLTGIINPALNIESIIELEEI